MKKIRRAAREHLLRVLDAYPRIVESAGSWVIYMPSPGGPMSEFRRIVEESQRELERLLLPPEMLVAQPSSYASLVFHHYMRERFVRYGL
jgi:hypothetical protein